MSRKSETVFRSRWWAVSLPAHWQAVEDAECVTLSGTGFPSAFQISAARKDADFVADEDLKDFAMQRLRDEGLLRSVNVGRFTGFYAEHIENGIFWREWWLRA